MYIWICYSWWNISFDDFMSIKALRFCNTSRFKVQIIGYCAGKAIRVDVSWRQKARGKLLKRDEAISQCTNEYEVPTEYLDLWLIIAQRLQFGLASSHHHAAKVKSDMISDHLWSKTRLEPLKGNTDPAQAPRRAGLTSLQLVNFSRNSGTAQTSASITRTMASLRDIISYHGHVMS